MKMGNVSFVRRRLHGFCLRLVLRSTRAFACVYVCACLARLPEIHLSCNSSFTTELIIQHIDTLPKYCHKTLDVRRST